MEISQTDDHEAILTIDHKIIIITIDPCFQTFIVSNYNRNRYLSNSRNRY